MAAMLRSPRLFTPAAPGALTLLSACLGVTPE
jgi:hypothetical protein